MSKIKRAWENYEEVEMTLRTSDAAAKVWHFLRDRSPKEIEISELVRELQLSKSAIMRALAEIEQAGIIFTEVKEDDYVDVC